ncbi:MAG: DUF1592 domain-containing protein [Bdellovibrionales bacterium]
MRHFSVSSLGAAAVLICAMPGCGPSFKAAEPAQLSNSGSNTPNPRSPDVDGKALYATNCSGCHGSLATSAKSGRTAAQITNALGTIEAMQNVARLSAIEIAAIASALSPSGAVACDSQADPGHVPIHRINKEEYSNSVRAILGITGTPGANLPDENTAFGFKNIASVLTVTSVSIDRYLEAAEQAVELAFTQNAVGIFKCNSQSVNAASLTRTCAEQILQRLAELAFRRPLSSLERTQLLGFLDKAGDEGLALSEGVRWGLEWVLITPSFLFRAIQHPSPNDPKSIKELTGYELASRMSFFLWSNQPDQELRTVAANGTLVQPAVLEAQVTRMLKDPKAHALIDGFADQWLELHRFENHTVDTNIYSFSESLRADMKTETRLLLEDVFINGLSPLRLINSDTSYLNRRLALHYGVSGGGTNDSSFVKTSIANTERRGLLGQGRVLTLTSMSNRTSVVRRGKWILDNILCEPPAPPPPDVSDGLAGDPGASLKERMARHRSQTTCASCHNSIDPLGFSLEAFDANGIWRTRYRDGSAVDTAGTLPDGRPVGGALDLSKILEADPRYRSCVTKKLMTYALGRGLEDKDSCTVNRLARDHVGDSIPMSSLIKAIVVSDPFRKQAGS